MDETTVAIAQMIKTIAVAADAEILNQDTTMAGTKASSADAAEAPTSAGDSNEQTVQDPTKNPWTAAEKAAAVVVLDKLDPSFTKKMREEKHKQDIWIPRAKKEFKAKLDRYQRGCEEVITSEVESFVAARFPSTDTEAHVMDLETAEAIKAFVKEKTKETTNQVVRYYGEFVKGLDEAVQERIDRIQPTLA